MTKQEEIREEIEARIRLGIIETTYKTADAIVEYLHSQGVVIKVDRELPKCVFYDDQMLMLVDCPLYNAGYVAVEPLIEKPK